MEYKDESIILRIREVMKEHGLKNQTQLGEAVGVKQSSISDMFSLKRSSMPLIEAISTKYQISKQWLVAGSGMKYQESKNSQDKSAPISNEKRLELIGELNRLYARHQDIIKEEQTIVKSIVEINRLLLLDGADIAGV